MSEWEPPVVRAQVGHYVFVLALLHHGDLLLDGRDVVTCQEQKQSACLIIPRD